MKARIPQIQIIHDVPASVREDFDGMFELTKREQLLRFQFTHDFEWVPNEHNLNYTVVARVKDAP